MAQANSQQQERDASADGKWYQKFFSYFSLLFSASPSRLDICLINTGLIFAIIAGIPFPLLAILFGQVIDDLNTVTCLGSSTVSSASSSDADYQDSVNSKVLLIVYLAIAQFIVMYIHLTCWSLTGARLAQRLRERYLENLLRQEVSFFDDLSSGEVSSRLDGDIQTIRNGTSEKVGLCISSFSFFITAYTVALIKQSALAGMLACLIPAYFLMSFVGKYYVEKFSAAVSDAVSDATAVASEALSHIMIVQAFGAEKRLLEKFSKGLSVARKEGIKKALVTGIQSGLIYFIAYGANGLAFWQGARNIANSIERDGQGATVGATYTVIFVLVDATLILSQVAPFVQYFAAAAGAFRKLGKDMNRVSRLDGVSEVHGVTADLGKDITFHNVSFTYPSRPGHRVLNDVSLTFPSGKHTAIVGLSGCGKSTIAGLLCRMYTQDEGRIEIDGPDTRNINVRHIRSQTSLVQQEPALLNRSVFENIASGLLKSNHAEDREFHQLLLSAAPAELAASLREDPTKDFLAAAQAQSDLMGRLAARAKSAAANADAEMFISRLPHHWATLVGQGGRLLSGGQRQRCALACALISRPALLILDEATSALDSASEQRVVEAIASKRQGKTLISIAHRLSTIKHADQILVMGGGRVLQRGTHQELMEIGGTYAEMVKLQTLRLEAEGTNQDADHVPCIDLDEGERPDQVRDEKITTKIGTVSVAESLQVPEEEPDLGTSASGPASIVPKMLSMIRRDALIILFALTASIIVGSAYSAEAVIFGNTVSHLNTCNSADSIRSSGVFFGLMFVVLAIIEFFANVISWSGFGYVSEKLLFRVRTGSLRSLLNQPLAWHQKPGRSAAQLLSIVTRDGAALAGLSGSVIGTTISIVFNLVGAIVLTMIVAWKIALVCIATVPLLLGAGLMELRVLTLFEERHETAHSASVAVAVEAVECIKTVAALALEQEIMANYRRTLAEPRKETTKLAFRACLWLAMTYFIGTLSYALTFWWGSKQIIAGAYSQTQFLICVMSLLVSAQLWGQMFALGPEITSARGAIARIFHVLDIDPRENEPVPPSEIDRGDGAAFDIESAAEKRLNSDPPCSIGMHVEMKDVCFSYSPQSDALILQDLSLNVEAGQFAALVGPSGAGKSTIVALLEKFYPVNQGSIKLDHRDITKETSLDFRDEIALVPQDSALFEGSIRFNVALGARSGQVVSDEQIECACQLANIHGKIASLPQKYDTPCGSSGGMLSGGERQRLAIARALIRNPRLLILDESTSALDAESEKLFQDGLDTARKDRGMTVIAIAHRLNTIRKADVIFVIDGGQCIDAGRHEELYARCDFYRNSVDQQSLAMM